LRVGFGFVRGRDFRVNRFGFNGLRGRSGEEPVPAKLAELVEDGLALESERTFAHGKELQELGAVHQRLEEGVEGVLGFGSPQAARSSTVAPGGFELSVGE